MNIKICKLHESQFKVALSTLVATASPLSCMTNIHAAMLPSVPLVGDVNAQDMLQIVLLERGFGAFPLASEMHDCCSV